MSEPPEGDDPPVVDPDAPADHASRPGEWDVLVAIAVGGVLGAEARYGIDRLLPPSTTGFPWATLTINVLGCLLMGMLMVALTELITPHRLARPFLGIGILGGFTTFSSFAVDAERLIRAHRAGLALVYVVATLVVAAAALAVGTWAARRAGPRVLGTRWSRKGLSGKGLSRKGLSGRRFGGPPTGAAQP